MSRYLDYEDVEAEEVLDRLLGYSYALCEYTEEHKPTRSQLQLKHEPLEIKKIEGYVEYRFLKVKDWCDIPLEHTDVLKDRVLVIPPSIFDVAYEKVRVTYTSGHTEIPDDLKTVAQEISDLLKFENTNAWSLSLSENSIETIHKYKQEGRR